MSCQPCTTTPETRYCRRPLRLAADGLTIARVPFGQEAHFVPGATCPQCATRLGDFHHVGCHAEECGSCKGKAWQCGCGQRTGTPEWSAIVAA
ncbi:MAG TPA: hypothetical protein VFH47_04660 [Candidatus Thermoplasmatota archaeon]|nr:hypothetical protein [Candidatus Thermoplasmatota archaeon]